MNSFRLLEPKPSLIFGSYIFKQTLKHVSIFAVKMPIAFPSLICGIILSQHLGILINSDAESKRESHISLHYRLFLGTHVPNIVMTSSMETSSSILKDGILVELKETYKASKLALKRKSYWKD